MDSTIWKSENKEEGTDENTLISEEAKVRRADETIAVV